MNTDPHDWDHEEREALAAVRDQIDALRRRHADDPPYEMLRAAQADALPADLQAAVAEHLAASRLSRTLADGIGEDGPALSEADAERLLARIKKEAAATGDAGIGRARVWGWLRPALAGAGLVAIASLVWIVSKTTEVGEPLGPPETQVVVALPPETPPFLLPFDKPDVRLSMASLTWRGASPAADQDNQLLRDLKPGLDAFRQGDYATANEQLTALAGRYPDAIEIPYYQGVSRLFLADYTGAIAAFEAASAIGDQTFAADVAWYRAVAEQRAGRVAEARTRLETICAARGPDAARACTAIEQMARAAASPQ